MRWAVVGVCVLIGGCGIQSAKEVARKYASSKDNASSQVAGDVQFRQNGLIADSTFAMDKAGGNSPPRAASPSPADRKIIYVADLSLIVEDFS